MIETSVPVLIVGGGPAGLSASMLLSTYGIDSLLINHRPGTSHLPKAHILNQRSMEIYRELGLADAIYARAAPPENFRYFGWYAGVAGEHGDYGRAIARLECWGNGGDDPRYQVASACRPANLPQIRLEPLLKAHAESLSTGQIRFNHELLSLEQDKNGVTATILDRDKGTQYAVRANFVFACDGGRTLGKQLGVEMEGPRNLGSFVSIYMSADLSKWVSDPEVLLRWIVSPDFGQPLSGVLCPMGPDHWGPDSEEWVFHWLLPWGDSRLADDDAVIANMHKTLGIPNFRPKIHVISRWTVEGLVASRYKAGRVFMVGDAAHRHPPTGALGMNTAVQDAYNLCWKVASVLREEASESLLDTYEVERRPVGQTVVRRSLENFKQHLSNMDALKMSPEAGPEHNWSRMRMLWSDSAEAKTIRKSFHEHLSMQSMEYSSLNVENGYRYDSAAVVPDGSAAPTDGSELILYTPSTRPGSPLPHAWVTNSDARRALSDLTGRGRFTLIVGEEGHAWIDAAHEIAAAHRLRLDILRIGVNSGDWIDSRHAWAAQREILPTGALIVRPDRFVAWRHLGASADSRSALKTAFERILGRETAS